MAMMRKPLANTASGPAAIAAAGISVDTKPKDPPGCASSCLPTSAKSDSSKQLVTSSSKPQLTAHCSFCCASCTSSAMPGQDSDSRASRTVRDETKASLAPNSSYCLRLNSSGITADTPRRCCRAFCCPGDDRLLKGASPWPSRPTLGGAAGAPGRSCAATWTLECCRASVSLSTPVVKPVASLALLAEKTTSREAKKTAKAAAPAFPGRLSRRRAWRACKSAIGTDRSKSRANSSCNNNNSS
mmetsp:Transcript_5050/g.9526  ORF Transcript_5050/g.9526 Transcript_5050/m.9526 type:complete len:243 (-) Transcript_5050:72-800(-)